MARIVSLGSALQDIYLIDKDDLKASQLDNRTIYGDILVGSKVDVDQIDYEIGGGGINSAVEFARHGHEAVFIGNIAHDSAGDAVLKLLDREGIDNNYVNFLEHKSTGTSVILLDTRSGERTILTCRGASEQFGNFSEQDLETIRPDWLYVTSLKGDFDTLERFFRKARELGTRIMFNPGNKELEDRQRLIDLFQYVDILSVNQSEAAQIADGENLLELFYHLINYVGMVLITAGSMGGVAGDNREAYRFGIYEDKKIKDATGAGDAFGSGFLAHLTDGKSLHDSIIYAAANSTSVITEIGANKGALTGGEQLHTMPIQII